ncbi:MAG: Holliday junction resolvase RuvX [SAR202 cluster bacterium Io17-Chloro-G1]|nr:MAG: Holliday junction resolvase RuvX [SAR202 cluster bacterium Io17-Chloro-G1]
MRIMALDVGDRRIGVALSDPTGLLATPLTAVDRLDARPSEFDEIISLAQENDVEAIIVGMPVTLAGRLGHQARQVRDFISELSDHTDLAIETVDERYSTVQAQRMLNESKRRPSKDRNQDRGHLDASAAAVFLQSYLDFRQ